MVLGESLAFSFSRSIFCVFLFFDGAGVVVEKSTSVSETDWSALVEMEAVC